MTLQQESENWVEVRSQASGLVVVEEHQWLMGRHHCFAAAGVCEVQPEKTFRIFIANFGNKPVHLKIDQTVAKADNHPSYIAEGGVSHGKVLGITTDDVRYRKHNHDARDIETTNRHLADVRESLTGEDEKPVTVDDIDFKIDERYHTGICAQHNA